MKIRARGYLTFKEKINNQTLELDLDSISLKDFLEKLCLEQGDELRRILFDPQTEEVQRQISLLVNGRHYTHLPDRLNTALKDGDQVDIFPPIAGGAS